MRRRLQNEWSDSLQNRKSVSRSLIGYVFECYFPLSGFHLATQNFRSVDLPDPFGPIKPMRSSSDTVKEIS